MADQPPPNKGLGQHFLTDRNILGAIAGSVDVGLDDTIIEVGPGSGSLTFVLAERARRVLALELDGGLVELLKSRAPDNVEVHHTDARRVKPGALLGSCGPYKLVGNLPYYAALPILRAFLESDCPPRVAAVLVQREVALQMCAAPGNMSLVSLAVQLFGTPRIARTVRPGSFNPPPKVTSSVVTIDLFDSPAEGVADTSAFFGLARAGFSAPRKQLRNALANGLGIPPSDAAVMLVRAGIDPRRRAETLSVAEWATLAKSGSQS